MNLTEVHMKRQSSLLATLALATFALVACSKSGTAPGTPAGGLADSADTAAADLSGTQATVAADPHDPCRLLTANEVEAVLGSKLIGPPYRSSNPLGDSAGWPQDEGSVCWYVGKDNRNLTVQADWENAGAISAGVSGTLAKAEGASKGMLRLQDGTELVGDWDEAKMLGCCSLQAMLGDSSVEIEFGGSLAMPQQAGELANKALARLTLCAHRALRLLDGRRRPAPARWRASARRGDQWPGLPDHLQRRARPQPDVDHRDTAQRLPHLPARECDLCRLRLRHQRLQRWQRATEVGRRRARSVGSRGTRTDPVQRRAP
jgi:hypothetical protein